MTPDGFRLGHSDLTSQNILHFSHRIDEIAVMCLGYHLEPVRFRAALSTNASTCLYGVLIELKPILSTTKRARTVLSSWAFD
jgi:hypothetical protein